MNRENRINIGKTGRGMSLITKCYIIQSLCSKDLNVILADTENEKNYSGDHVEKFTGKPLVLAGVHDIEAYDIINNSVKRRIYKVI